MNIGKVRAKIAAVEAVMGNGVYEPGIMKKDLKAAFKELEYTKVEKFCRFAAVRFVDRMEKRGGGKAVKQWKYVRRMMISDLSKSLMESFVLKGKRGF